MNKLTCDLKSGNLLIDESVVAPLSRSDFLNVISSHNIGFKEVTRNEGWPTYGLPVEFLGEKFHMNVSYECEKIDSVWLSWKGGISSKKGYDTTERELITDKNSLTRMISKMTGKSPEEKEYNCDCFLFDWGYISTAASLQPPMVTVGFVWK